MDDMLSTVLTQRQAADLLQATEKTLEAWRHRGGGPPFVKIGAKLVRYRLSDLERWLDERVRLSTSDSGRGKQERSAQR